MAKYQVYTFVFETAIWEKLLAHCEKWHRSRSNFIEWVIIKRMRSDVRSFVSFAPPCSDLEQGVTEPLHKYSMSLKEIYNNFLDESAPRKMNRYVLEAWLREELQHG